jgi:hypothetical protein
VLALDQLDVDSVAVVAVAVELESSVKDATALISASPSVKVYGISLTCPLII